MSLEVINLQCIRGDRELFSKLSFVVNERQLLRLNGQNGAGKTTLLRTLCGLFEADNGEVLWYGKSIKKHDDDYRKALFYQGHNNAIKADLNALKNLRINTSLSSEDHSDESLMNALDEMGLYGFEYFPTRQLSQGQKRRVALAGLLLSKAKLWILDEPFVALDFEAVNRLKDIISKHVENDGIVILTTHQEVALNSGDILTVNLDDHFQESEVMASHV